MLPESPLVKKKERKKKEKVKGDTKVDRNNVSMYVGMKIFEQFFARIDTKVKYKCY